MGYLFVAVALTAGAVKGFCGKKTSGFVRETSDAILINIIRMLFCVAIGFAIISFQGNLSLIAIDKETILISFFSGIMTSFFVISWLIAVRQSAYMMIDVFLMLGVTVTIICSFFAFDEPIRITQCIGIAVLIIAVGFMYSYNNSIKSKLTLRSFLLLSVCGISSGLADFSQKAFVKLTAGNSAVFNFYTYVFSAIFLISFYFIIKGKNRFQENKSAILKRIMPYVAIMSVCLFANSFFKTLAANYLTAAKLYPLNQGMSLVIASVMATVLFKEKMTVKCIIGMILAFLALILINLF